MMHKIRTIIIDYDPLELVEKLSLSDFITWAKEYNIFQESNSKRYDSVCNLIKARLDREGLSHETVRPNK